MSIRCLRLPFVDVLVLAFDIPEPISVQRHEVIILKIGHLEVKLVVSDLNARPKNRTITGTTIHQPCKEASLLLLLD